MSGNTFKNEQPGQKEEKKSLFSAFERLLRYDAGAGEVLPLRYIPHILYVAAFLIFYIWNTHYAEKMTRRLNDLQVEVEDLRADYTTLKADYMYSSKQSEVADMVQSMGLKENEEPPQIIVIDEHE